MQVVSGGGFGILKPTYKERFPLSSTILVSYTDFWHLSQGIFLKLVLIGFYIYEPICNQIMYNVVIEFVALYVIMLIPFEITHYLIKRN